MSTGIPEKDSKCSTHCENNLQFFCSNCKKSACKDCEHILECYHNNHDVVPVHSQTDEVDQTAMKLIKIAEEMKRQLEKSFDSIVENQRKFENNIKLCRSAIEMKERKIIEKVKVESRNLVSDLDKLYKKRQEATTKELEDLDSKQTQIESLKASIKSIMKEPEGKENDLDELDKKIIEVKANVLKADNDIFSLYNKHVIPTFITSPHLNKLMDTEGIGNIVTVDERFNVANNDRSIIVTKGEKFVVKVSCLIKDEECQLAATLTSSSGEESRPHVKYQGNGEYRITSSCNIEGDWKMKITVADEHVKGSQVNVKGSPVNVKVENLGLVRTIRKISDYIKDNHRVSDVMLQTNGCLLVSSMSKQMLRFNQSGSVVDKLLMPQDTRPYRMHKMSNGNVVYSDLNKCVVMCDKKTKHTTFIW